MDKCFQRWPGAAWHYTLACVMHRIPSVHRLTSNVIYFQVVHMFCLHVPSGDVLTCWRALCPFYAMQNARRCSPCPRRSPRHRQSLLVSLGLHDKHVHRNEHPNCCANKRCCRFLKLQTHDVESLTQCLYMTFHSMQLLHNAEKSSRVIPGQLDLLHVLANGSCLGWLGFGLASCMHVKGDGCCSVSDLLADCGGPCNLHVRVSTPSPSFSRSFTADSLALQATAMMFLSLLQL